MKTLYAAALMITSLFLACGLPPGNGQITELSDMTSLVSETVILEYLDSITVPDLSRAPDGISAGVDGTLYLCDKDNGRVILLDRNGKLTANYDGPDTRSGPAFSPVDLSVSGGIEVYVLDSGTSRIIRLDRNLRNAYTVYAPDQGRDSLFDTFRGIAFDRTTGDIYITDHDNGTVRRIDMLGGNVQSSGSFGQGRIKLLEPAGIDVADDGFIYIADTRNNAVAMQQHTGSTLTLLGDDVLMQPVDVVALPDGNIAVAEHRGVVVIDRSGTPCGIAGFGNEPVIRPRSITYSEGILSVSDDISGGIVRFRIRYP